MLAGSLILSRFDLWPALLTVAALAALLRERHVLGWGAARRGGRGQALAARARSARARLVVPTRARIRAALAGLAVVAAVFVPFAVVAPHGLWSSLSGQASRPLQIESLGASLFTTFGHPSVISSHGSQNVAGHGAVAAVFALLQIAALVALWIAFARGPVTGDRLLRYSAAAVCAFIAFGKVLSPQFLLWLIPLVPLVRGPPRLAATALLTAALVLTQVWFPQPLLGLRRTRSTSRESCCAATWRSSRSLVVLAWPDRVAQRGRECLTVSRDSESNTGGVEWRALRLRTRSKRPRRRLPTSRRHARLGADF